MVMKQFRSDKRAIKRGHLKHVLTPIPNNPVGIENLYNVQLDRRANNGKWVFYKNLGNQIIKTENK